MIHYPSLFAETIRHIPRGGDPVDVPGCVVQNMASNEPDATDLVGIWRTETQMTVYVPPEQAAHIDSTSQLVVRGVTYRVDGEVIPERSVFTGETGMVPVNVSRVTG